MEIRKMYHVSSRGLKIISILFWYIGGAFLMLKGCRLLSEAETLKPDQIWPWMAVFIGLVLGSLKSKFVFSKSCQKNMARIDTLKQPKIWQFFRPRFFIFLSLMIITGTILSKLVNHNYPLLIGVAIVDFSIAIALIGSSYIFWTYKTHVK